VIDTRSFALGLDFGTNTVRALIVRVSDGAEVGTHVAAYPHGVEGIILDERDPDLARQHPDDYLTGMDEAVRGAIRDAAANEPGFDPTQILAIGVDTTGSTPLPLDAEGTPLAFHERFRDNPNAMAWLWKDHTSTAEAAEITAKAAELRPHYLLKCGGTYSSEWFWSKILHCLRVAPEVFDAAHIWIECADFVPAVLTGTCRPGAYRPSVCAAGHKAMYNDGWGGLPDADFLSTLHPKLGDLRRRLFDKAYTVDQPAGVLAEVWARRFGIPAGIPVAVGAFDAHLGAVGTGIRPGTLVKIIGTSTCDMMVAPNDRPLPDIPGLCGIVDGSILPGHFGMEAGQSAVGDIFNWFVSHIGGTHEELTAGAARLRPGESGLLALDWNNGNRTVLVDQRLTGLLVGQTLHTRPEEIYRTLIEATAFGALVIMERFEEYGVKVERVANCGGIAEKNPLAMQIYADITNRPMHVSRSAQTCALGSAVAAAVVGGAYRSVPEAQEAMTALRPQPFMPDPAAHAVYKKLFSLYRDLHDAFGRKEWTGSLFHVMKRLIEIRDEVRGTA